MERATRRLGLNYWLSWVVANALAWAVGIALPWLVGVWGVGAALLMGAAQWRVLSRAFPHSPWWLVGYALAWLVAVVVGAHFGFLVPDPVWFGASGGSIAGLMQSLVLRRYVRRPIAWLPTMIASAILGCVAGVRVGWTVYANSGSETAGYVTGGAVAGATFGFLSANVLLYLVRHERKAPAAPERFAQ